MPTQNSSSQITISGVDTPNGEINTQTGIGNPTETSNIQIGFYWYGSQMYLKKFVIYNSSNHSNFITYTCPSSMQTLPNYTSGTPTPIIFTIQDNDFASWTSADVYTYVAATQSGTAMSSGITVNNFLTSYVYNSTAPSDQTPVPVITGDDEKEPSPEQGQEGTNDE